MHERVWFDLSEVQKNKKNVFCFEYKYFNR